VRRVLAALAFVAALTSIGAGTAPLAGAAGGTIVGRVRISGTPPGNPILRMGMDPGCVALTGGKRLPDQIVVITPDGSVTNVFAKLDGTFPATPVPKQPVVIDQRGCMYSPRVVGARAGQLLEIHNSDALLHNAHSATAQNNAFNFAQPLAGANNSVTLTAQDTMLHLTCDVHRWMNAYVGIVSHPYFSVSGANGEFRIEHVPPGTYRLQLWHERLGQLTQPVKVSEGAIAHVDAVYASK
jgi:hypothetical protein